MPNTAIRMPTVRNIFCQNGFIRSRMRAFTTALSKLRLISRMPRIRQRTRACGPPYTKAIARATMVIANDHPKVLKIKLEQLLERQALSRRRRQDGSVRPGS